MDNSKTKFILRRYWLFNRFDFLINYFLHIFKILNFLHPFSKDLWFSEFISDGFVKTILLCLDLYRTTLIKLISYEVSFIIDKSENHRSIL